MPSGTTEKHGPHQTHKAAQQQRSNHCAPQPEAMRRVLYPVSGGSSYEDKKVGRG